MGNLDSQNNVSPSKQPSLPKPDSENITTKNNIVCDVPPETVGKLDSQNSQKSDSSPKPSISSPHKSVSENITTKNNVISDVPPKTQIS